jgi:hypothetical protein
MLLARRNISANLNVVSLHNNPVSSHLSQTFWTCFRRYSVCALALLLTGAVFVVGGLRVGAGRIGHATQSAPAAIPEYSVKRIPVAQIILGPKGFAPAEINRPKGPFILAIHNRAEIDDLSLSLSKVTGNKMREMNFRKKKLDWRSLITLPPGDYVLSVAGRPEWVCNIKIKGN